MVPCILKKNNKNESVYTSQVIARDKLILHYEPRITRMQGDKCG